MINTPDYGSTTDKSAKQSFVEITVDEEAANQPTLAPVGSRLKRNAQIEYNPFDWQRTLLVVKGRPHSYSNYVSGQQAFYEIKTRIRVFTHSLLNMIDRDAVLKNHRARMLAYAIAFPFTPAELRRERQFEKNAVEDILSDADVELITSSVSMPAYVLEALSQMTEKYCKRVPAASKKTLHDSVLALYKPYYEAERICSNPMGFSYVAHLRLLLMTYLTTLPLALVEQMGFSTIPVFWVITYALMSLEMLAVEVENPFGYQASDLRLFQYSVLVRDTVLESWANWLGDLGKVLDEKDMSDYDDFGEKEENEEVSSWFDYW